MYLGLDLGTSSVKAVLLGADGAIAAQASAPLIVSPPQALWSEQDPADWVVAGEAAILQLPTSLRRSVKAMGLSGQMHGATLLGANDRPLRPAMLWNDGRAHAECTALEAREPGSRRITGNKAMPGFTAPKVAWVREREPDIFARTRKVVLPKDYLRLVWTGDHATDCSDASGTLWLDVGQRDWSEAMLAATGLAREHMPTLFEGSEATGTLTASAAERLGLNQVPVAAGGGDQAAGGIGAGVIAPGNASLALGTSGVLFAASDGFKASPDKAAHAFCHALPGRWHQMAVILSAASAIDWAGQVACYKTPEDAYAGAEAHGRSDGVLFLPYLSGERTPHDDAHARGAWFGLGMETTRASLVHAALEGVAFAFADGLDALKAGGGSLQFANVIGGGARSTYWGKILASVLGLPIVYREGAEAGPALGAARLARLALTGEDPAEICQPGPVREIIEPDLDLANKYGARLIRWRALYHATKHLTAESSDL